MYAFSREIERDIFKGMESPELYTVKGLRALHEEVKDASTIYLNVLYAYQNIIGIIAAQLDDIEESKYFIAPDTLADITTNVDPATYFSQALAEALYGYCWYASAYYGDITNRLLKAYSKDLSKNPKADFKVLTTLFNQHVKESKLDQDKKKTFTAANSIVKSYLDSVTRKSKRKRNENIPEEVPATKRITPKDRPVPEQPAIPKLTTKRKAPEAGHEDEKRSKKQKEEEKVEEQKPEEKEEEEEKPEQKELS